MVVSPVFVPIEKHDVGWLRFGYDFTGFSEMRYGCLATCESFLESDVSKRLSGLIVAPRYEHTAPCHAIHSEPLAVLCLVAIRRGFGLSDFTRCYVDWGHINCSLWFHGIKYVSTQDRVSL